MKWGDHQAPVDRNFFWGLRLQKPYISCTGPSGQVVWKLLKGKSKPCRPCRHSSRRQSCSKLRWLTTDIHFQRGQMLLHTSRWHTLKAAGLTKFWAHWKALNSLNEVLFILILRDFIIAIDLPWVHKLMVVEQLCFIQGLRLEAIGSQFSPQGLAIGLRQYIAADFSRAYCILGSMQLQHRCECACLPIWSYIAIHMLYNIKHLHTYTDTHIYIPYIYITYIYITHIYI